MSRREFVVIEYLPSAMHGHRPVVVRIDGHWARKADAVEVAEWMAEQPLIEGSRVVVAQVVAVTRQSPREQAG